MTPQSRMMSKALLMKYAGELTGRPNPYCQGTPPKTRRNRVRPKVHNIRGVEQVINHRQ